MAEFVATAIVLDRIPVRECDELVHFYSRGRGRIVARAVSMRKANSRFSHHVDPLSLVEVRLVGAGPYVLADAVVKDRFAALRASTKEFSRALRLASFIKEFFPEGGAADRAWDFLLASFARGSVDARGFLSLLGFGAGGACKRCGAASPKGFSLDDHAFLCGACSSKIPDNRLLYM